MWPAATANLMFKVLWEGLLCGQQLRTSLFFQCSKVPAAGGTIEDAAVALKDADSYASIRSAFLTCAPLNYTLVRETFQPRQQNVWYTKLVFPVGLPGARPAATAANRQATVVRRGIFASRKGVGGIRVPMSDAAGIAVDGVYVQAVRDMLDAFSETLRPNVATDEADPWIYKQGIMSTANDGITPLFSETFESFSQPEVRVIRRRTVGLGI